MARRHVGMAAVATAALTLSLLSGCGGGAGGAAPKAQEGEQPKVSGKISGSGEDAESTSSDAAAAEEAPAAQEVASLAKEDLLGYWKVDSSTGEDSEAAFVVYRFKKDGTFVMIANAAGAELKRPGTYEIQDGKAYVDVAEGASSEVNGTTYSANEIKDAEITLDGDKLTAKGISSNGDLTATKITKETYKEMAAKAATYGPQRISVGETKAGEGYSFTVNSFDFKDEIYPSDTSGYYRYYPHEDGKSYLVADVTFVNDGTEYAVPGYSTAALLKVGDNKYTASVETDGGSNFLRSYSTEAKDSSRLIIYAQVPNAAIEEGGEVQLLWSVPQGGVLNNYYSSDGDNTTYQLIK